MDTSRRTVSFLSLLLVLSIPGFAQLSTGSLSGTVTDRSGGAVAGATVTATQTTTGRSLLTVSTEAGLYAFPNLDVGTYTGVELCAEGFVGILGSHGGGERVLCVHGDTLCTRDIGYQRLRRVLRSKSVTWLR